MMGLKVWKFGRLHIVCDGDTLGSLEVCKLGSLYILSGIDEFGVLEVYTLCGMVIHLEVWKFAHCV